MRGVAQTHFPLSWMIQKDPEQSIRCLLAHSMQHPRTLFPRDARKNYWPYQHQESEAPREVGAEGPDGQTVLVADVPGKHSL